ncbi:MAG: hypothetical protein CM15mP120_28530 [Pseudomonadota bacterium]|nr:MAG: hypothetical protein CM15mP120_28530 [Pseudomonadota bacterium]
MNLFRLIFAAALLSWAPFSVAEQVVNVYSARHYDTDMALYERFTEETGISVNLIEGGSDALIERIVNEGKFSPADMMITVDAGACGARRKKTSFRPLSHPIEPTHSRSFTSPRRALVRLVETRTSDCLQQKPRFK